MPCRTDEDPYADYRLAKGELDKLTAMFCEQFGSWEEYGQMPGLRHEVKLWWEKHKEADRARREREKNLALAARQARIERVVKEAAELGLTVTGVGCGT